MVFEVLIETMTTACSIVAGALLAYGASYTLEIHKLKYGRDIKKLRKMRDNTFEAGALLLISVIILSMLSKVGWGI